jgi:hypothetical protein
MAHSGIGYLGGTTERKRPLRVKLSVKETAWMTSCVHLLGHIQGPRRGCQNRSLSCPKASDLSLNADIWSSHLKGHHIDGSHDIWAPQSSLYPSTCHASPRSVTIPEQAAHLHTKVISPVVSLYSRKSILSGLGLKRNARCE